MRTRHRATDRPPDAPDARVRRIVDEIRAYLDDDSIAPTQRVSGLRHLAVETTELVDQAVTHAHDDHEVTWAELGRTLGMEKNSMPAFRARYQSRRDGEHVQVHAAPAPATRGSSTQS